MRYQSNLLTVEDLSIYIGDRFIIKGATFNIFKGEKVALAGPSGSGKTLTAYAITGLIDSIFKVSAQLMFLEPHSGIKIDLSNLKASDYRQIGFVFQEPQVALNPLLSVGQQLKEGIEKFVPSSEIDRVIKSLLSDLELPNDFSFLEAFPHELSGGQQQRVVIGMAIAKNPSLLIADEPTTSLDSKTTVEILELIEKLVNKKKMSLLLITHDQKIIQKYCDRILTINPGQKNYEKISKTSFEIKSAKVQESALISLNKVNLHLKRRNANLQPILQNLSLSIYKAEIIGLVGKSGSGKSSLCKILSGLLKTQNGEIILNCIPQKIQLVQQDPFQSLNPQLNVEETLREALIHANNFDSLQSLESKLSSILNEVGLSDNYRNRRPFELSGGERQRIAIARSLAIEPELLICDEAVSALDYPTQYMIIKLLTNLNKKRKMAILFVTHNLDLVDFCQTIWVLDNGLLEIVNRNKDGNLDFSSTAGQELMNYNNFFKKSKS